MYQIWVAPNFLILRNVESSKKLIFPQPFSAKVPFFLHSNVLFPNKRVKTWYMIILCFMVLFYS